jgi:cyclic lactone autoinducer peptide
MKKITLGMSRIVSCLALMVTVMNVNSACFFLMHQPELPKGSDSLRKY